MPLDIKYASAYVSNLDLSGRTVAVFGGTNGIGETVVTTLGSLGCRVVVLGRDAVNAGRIKDQVKMMKPRGDVAEVTFIQCDLRTVAGMKESVARLGDAAGSSGLDSVILSHHGMPSGRMIFTTDGHEQGYAVQSLSRFVISYQVANLGLLKPDATVVFIANSGRDLKDLSVDDLSLIEGSAGQSKIGLFIKQNLRDNTVLDSITIASVSSRQELSKRFPRYQFHNIVPGAIVTPTYNWKQIPFPLDWLTWLMSFVIGKTREEFAPFPIYVALCDQKDRVEMLKDIRMWTMRYKASEPGPWAGTERNRLALWDKLCESL